MNAIFLASTFLMLLLAMSFATMPLIRGARSSSSGFVNVPVLVALTALLLAIGLYAAIGRPDIASAGSVNESYRVEPQRQLAEDGKKAASVDELLAGLEQRLQEDPDDAKGWLLLAKSYDHLGRERDAVAAYEKATQLGLTDSELEARLN